MDYYIDVTCTQPTDISTVECVYMYRYFCLCVHECTLYGDSTDSNTVRNPNADFKLSVLPRNDCH